MSKDLSLPNLYKDLGYIIYGTEAHQFLFSIFPPKVGTSIIEAGCGSAKLGVAYAMRGATVVPFDYSGAVVNYASRIMIALWYLARPNYPQPEITQGDILKSPETWTGRTKLEGQLVDFVFNEGVPQHWPDEEHRQGAINNMVKAAKIGGMVCVMGNNGLRMEERIADKEFSFKYEGMPPHRKCFKPDELAMRLEKAGLHDVQVAAVSPLVPIEVSYLIAGWGVK